MTEQQKTFLSIVILGVIGGSLAGFIKFGVQTIPPSTFTFLRFFIAALCMLPFLFKEIRTLTFSTLKKSIGVSILAVANVAIFAFGVQYTTAVISSLLYVTAPVMIALLSYFFLKERFSPRKITGILLGLSGVVFLLLLPALTRGAQFSGTLFGNVAVLIAVLCFAFYTVLSKKVVQVISPVLFTFIFVATATVTLLPLVVIDWLAHPGWIYSLAWPAVASVLYVGVIGGAINYLLYQSTIKRATPVIVSMMMFLQPISAYVVGLFLLGEKLIAGVVIGAIMAVLGAWIVTTEKKRE